jgi:hypothetical protein
VLAVVAVLVSVCAFNNVYGDDAAVRSDAEGVACPRGCGNTVSVKVDRSPLAETIQFTTSKGTLTVSCSRAAILIGPYSCSRE